MVRPQDVNAVLGAKSGAQSLTRRPLLLQVSFHPRKAHILASGSLDFEVRVWDAISAACLVATNFGAQRWKAVPSLRSPSPLTHRTGRPIASLAFYPDSDLLAVASGHKARGTVTSTCLPSP